MNPRLFQSSSFLASFFLVVFGVFLPAPPAAASCAAPPPGLVSWWRAEMNADDIVSLNHGIMSGVTIVTGKVGQAFSFSGNSSRVLIPASSRMDSTTNAGLTLEAWINPQNVSTPQPLAEWSDGGIGAHFWISVSLSQSEGGIGSLFANLGGGHLLSAPGLLTNGGFQHVALTYDRITGVGALYLNGNQVDMRTLGSFVPPTRSNLQLGERPPGQPSAANYVGGMDEISYYNRALSSGEIQAIYQAGAAGKCVPLTSLFILTQPMGLTTNAGSTVSFSVLAGGGTNIGYQWNYNGSPISAATTSALVLTNVGTNHAGTYRVTLTNQLGSLESSNAQLVVLVFPPSFVLQPTNQLRAIGETVVFSSAVTGTAPLAYQWSFNNTPLPGLTNAHLVLANATAAQSGLYSVTASNLFGFQTSSNALLTMVALATNLFDDFDPATDPAQWSAFGGTVQATNHGGFVSPSNSLWFGGSGLRFAATRSINTTNAYGIHFSLRVADGLSSLWDRPELPGDGVVLEYSTNTGASWLEFGRYNTPAFTNWTALSVEIPSRARIPAVRFRWRQLANSGSTADHWALDDVALTTIAVPPVITAHPQGRVALAGQTVQFNVTATSAPLLFQWRRNGTALPAMTNGTLVLTNVQPSQAGEYSVLITNLVGAALSSNATLVVRAIAATSNGQPLTNTPHYFIGSHPIELTNYFTGGLTFYSLDGSTPNFAATPYSGPFVVAQNATLRAIAYRNDFLESAELGPLALVQVTGYALTAVGSSGGTVTLNPPGSAYLSNSVVTVTAVPAPGWTFLKWLGDASGSSVSTNVAMSRDKTVRAIFVTSVLTTAAGGGVVVLNPPGGVYPAGSMVQVSALPGAGNQFGIWGNAASGNQNPLQFMVTNANPTVSALFGPVGSGQVALAVVPVGRGRVTVSPNANTYVSGSGVTITATPDQEQEFLGWAGDAAGAENPLPLTLDASKVIYANFTRGASLTGELLGQEGFKLKLSTHEAATYRLEASTNLMEWTNLVIFTNSMGDSEFTDSAATNFPGRYYRASQTH